MKYAPTLLCLFTCSLAQATDYTLTISATHGTVLTDPNTSTFAEGTVVRLIPLPDVGYCFDDWSGDANSTRLVETLVMNGNKSVTAHFETWHAPLGIPEPNFGITETYRMYDTEGNRAAGLTYNASPGGGYYTHYVDSTDAASTDTDNDYGSPAKPRKTVPRDLPAGSVVEVHNGMNYNGGDSSYCFLTGQGTAQYPIFVRGVGAPHSELTFDVAYPESTAYMIVEGFTTPSVNVSYSVSTFNTNHVCIRNCEMTVHGAAEHGGFGVGTNGYSSNFVEDVVFYRNVVRDYGQWDANLAEGDNDFGGSAASEGARRVWIIDNVIYHIESTGFVVCPNNQNISNQAETCPNRIYVGRNVAFRNKQDGFWTKTGRDIIFSENTCYAHYASSSSNGSGFGLQYNPTRVWYIFNTSFCNHWGFTCGSRQTEEAIDEYCFIGNVSEDCGSGFCFNGTVPTTPIKVFQNTINRGENGIENNYFQASVLALNNIISGTTHDVNVAENSTTSTFNIDYCVFNGGNYVWYNNTYPSLTAFQSGTGKGSHCLSSDPLFVSAANLRLQGSSPAKDAASYTGTAVETAYNRFYSLYGVSIARDMDGTARPQGAGWDIGAYECVLSPVGDLRVSGTGSDSLTLTWTVPGQAGVTATPAGYDVRYAGSTITTANWESATQVQGEPVASALGTQQSFTVTGLNAGTTYYVAMKVADGGGHFSALSNVVSATTAPSGNHAPVLTPVGDKSVVEEEALTFVVSATDADGDSLTYATGSLPTGAAFDAGTHRFTWTPARGQSGVYHVMFQVGDGRVTVSETIAITVRSGVDQAPVLAAIGNKSVSENVALSFSLSATDPDGDPLTFSSTALPSGASLTGGVFRWTPAYSQAGSYQVTFTVSDGQLTDAETITITVADVTDITPPAVQAVYPLADAVQVPVSPLIALAVTDAGQGVNAASVTIRVNDQLVYSGDNSLYNSAGGVCRRVGTRTNYRYSYYPSQSFDFDQTVTVRVAASDAAGNVMTPVAYEFVTEMRAFGANQAVSSGSGACGHPAAVTDSHGNIWAVWHSGPEGARDAYVAERSAQTRQWGAPLALTSLASDQCNPVMAIGPDDTLYVAWQDNRRGKWDIYVTASADGKVWLDPIRVTDSNSNHTHPAISADHATPCGVAIAWEDDAAGNLDIGIATSNSRFVTKTVAQVTSNAASQTEPALTVGADNTIYLVWTDRRNGSADIYGSSSGVAGWANTALVTGAGNQSRPALAGEPDTSTLHVLWVDDAAGNADVFYGTSNGLPAQPLSGRLLIDDSSGADQSTPTVVAAKDPCNVTRVYVCWQDNRSVNSSHDSDLYFVEIRSGVGDTNILVGDDGTNSGQSEPVVACDEYGQPAVLWTDNRGGTPQIYSAFSSYVKPAALASGTIAHLTGGRVGADPATITGSDDVSIAVPASAYTSDMTLSIAAIENSPRFNTPVLAGFEVGPSGIQFSFPATVTIPYTPSAAGHAVPYWYDKLTGTLSQEGISAVTSTRLTDGLSVLSFKTTHLTPFYVLDESASSAVGGGGGGGGCAVAPRGTPVNPIECLLPYAGALAAILVWWRRDYKTRARQH